jgi:hypothetical protein
VPTATIGILSVARLAAPTDGPIATITSTCSANGSCIRLGKRSYRPSAERRSIMMVRPLDQPEVTQAIHELLVKAISGYLADGDVIENERDPRHLLSQLRIGAT